FSRDWSSDVCSSDLGKSLAYLIPAAKFARETGERVVISTNTINLQEQLIQKDIPFVSSVFSPDLKAVLVKGWQNYLCLYRYQNEIGRASCRERACIA